ncbi:hypothetical protein KAJ83_09655 [Marivibrio halodurans]|uniref:Uncharacterized protein n=1 Tax=Marivibrio halodurans TaxID=2039722 RepID=A0A8J7SIT9_9PROT|nr:hypothetical protein [Marivibrio halodurans]MBP5857273.1 hypothetical protein [Marivibrio halodurans]
MRDSWALFGGGVLFGAVAIGLITSIDSHIFDGESSAVITGVFTMLGAVVAGGGAYIAASRQIVADQNLRHGEYHRTIVDEANYLRIRLEALDPKAHEIRKIYNTRGPSPSDEDIDEFLQESARYAEHLEAIEKSLLTSPPTYTEIAEKLDELRFTIEGVKNLAASDYATRVQRGDIETRYAAAFGIVNGLCCQHRTLISHLQKMAVHHREVASSYGLIF